MFRPDVGQVARLGVGRQVGRAGDAGRRDARVVGRAVEGAPGRERLAPLGDVDDFNGDGAFRTGADARGRGTHLQAAVAHVALADDAALGVVLRHAVGAV